MYMIDQRPNSSSEQNNNVINHNNNSTINRHALRWTRRNGGNRSPFNPVIVLCGGNVSSESHKNNNGSRGEVRRFDDDDNGLGLRSLPTCMLEFLLGSGFDRLLEQLSQIKINCIECYEHPSASKPPLIPYRQSKSMRSTWIWNLTIQFAKRFLRWELQGHSVALTND
ncbi:hypothetical protein AHAS_Ahas16G0128600 [Arachis hypogaea]